MTNKEAIERLNQLTLLGDEEKLIEDLEAIKIAIKALKFTESQRICCDNCINYNRKSREVCTSPFGQCAFFDDKQ